MEAIPQSSNYSMSKVCTFHQLSPYLGKLNPKIVRELLLNYTKPGDTVLDPFAGSGTVPLEALLLERNILANDINPYAAVLAKAKIYPPNSLEEVLKKTTYYLKYSKKDVSKISLDEVPEWVKKFFHHSTLKEIIALSRLLIRNEENFIISCLLGILHHQRPGFLSYPSSHVVPYLREKKFPRDTHPQLYDYRNVETRLLKKIERSFRNVPKINPLLSREFRSEDAKELRLEKNTIDAVLTSPPYMNALDYGRDNRLRLWFLSVQDYKSYDKISPSTPEHFKLLMSAVLDNISYSLKPGSPCIFVLGDVNKNGKSVNTSLIIEDIISSIKCLYIEDIFEDEIPDKRRARKEGKMTKKEWRIIMRKETDNAC